jgi:hypothetical protein
MSGARFSAVTSRHMGRTLSMNNNPLITALQQEAQRIEEDTLYSSKGHFEAGSHWHRLHLWLGIPTALLAGVAGVSAFQNLPEIAGGISMLVAALAAVSTFLNPDEKAQAHHLAGAKFNDLRTRARIFREIDLQSDVDIKELTASLKQLADEKRDLNLKQSANTTPAF